MTNVKRFKPLGDMVERSTLGGGTYVLASDYEALRTQLNESLEAHHQLIEHTNETERHLDEAAKLLSGIVQGGDAYLECIDMDSATGKQVASLLEYVAQFQPEPHAPDEDISDGNWRMNPCKQGHRDVGASGGAAYCYQCDETISADSTQEAFEKWNATHPAVPV